MAELKTPSSEPRTATKPIRVVCQNCNLVDPHTLVRYPDGKPVQVEKITPWLQMQIDAGLMLSI